MVSEGLGVDEPDRPSWLFLTRPDGWAEELAIFDDAAREESDETSAQSELRSVQRKLDATTAALEETRSELEAARAASRSAEVEAARARAELGTARESLVKAVKAADELQIDRDRTVRNLKTAEELANQRLVTVRALEAELSDLAEQIAEAQTTEPNSDTATAALHGSGSALESTESAADGAGSIPVGSGPIPSRAKSAADLVDVVALSRAVDAAVDSLGGLLDAFGVVSQVLRQGIDPDADNDGKQRESSTTPSDAHSGADGAPESDGATEPRGESASRRFPIRLRQGAVEGSPAGIDQILRTPDVLVFVDGYNVAMNAWPALGKSEQRDSLIRLAGTIAARSWADIHIVFDGVGDGSRPTVGAALPVRVHFSDAHTEADDVILDLVARTRRPVLVVTSDKRIIAGARQQGANVVTSPQYLAYARAQGL